MKYILLIISILLCFSACQETDTYRPKAEVLSFSVDTLTFDTVFSTVGSTTKKLLVYNHLKQNLHFSSIALAGAANSQFRLNVDGARNANNSFTQIDIAPRDSMYIFVEVTVNPQNSNAPVLVCDSIIFETSNKTKRVVLEAFGQDVIFFDKKIIRNDTVLNANRPYIIKDYLAVDYEKTLTIQAGARLYFHNNANLIVYGNLIINGTYEQPVYLRGDRLDNVAFSTPVPYNYVAGQWGGIYLLWDRGNHLINNAIISSGYSGFQIQNDNRTQLPTLRINNTRIHNFLYYGIVAQNGNVTVTNSEISNTGSYALYLSGGKHRFIHTTVANYYSRNPFEPNTRQNVPSVLIMSLDKIAPMTTEFTNCVIAGTAETEFSIVDRHINNYNGVFANSYIMRKNALTTPQYLDISWGHLRDTVFTYTNLDYKNKKYFNFALDSLSPARSIADPAVAVQFPLDLNGKSRLDDGKPDAGAYEF
ncbi:MAG: right-handed parallel beta-helix repeat-containing protein [Paludibacter sp.]|nr:right-handed parallel beta-helix repeat-containing protein [Paludibacter sp.]